MSANFEEWTDVFTDEDNGLPVPADVEYHEETKTVFDGQGPKNYLTFAAGGYSFSMMTKDSYYR